MKPGPKSPPDFLPRIESDPPTTPAPAPAPTRSRFVQHWIYEKPPDRDSYLLLTVERTIVEGIWYGQVGDRFIAWCPKPHPNKGIEKQLIAAGKIKR